MSYGASTEESAIATAAATIAKSLALKTVLAEADIVALTPLALYSSGGSSAPLRADIVTWFALERVATAIGRPVTRLTSGASVVPAPGALVMIDEPLAPNQDQAARLEPAALVLAPSQWLVMLAAANVRTLPLSGSPAPSPDPRKSPSPRQG